MTVAPRQRPSQGEGRAGDGPLSGSFEVVEHRVDAAEGLGHVSEVTLPLRASRGAAAPAPLGGRIGQERLDRGARGDS